MPPSGSWKKRRTRAPPINVSRLISALRIGAINRSIRISALSTRIVARPRLLSPRLASLRRKSRAIEINHLPRS